MSVFSDKYSPYGPGEAAPIRSLKDPELQKRLRGYKRSVAKRYEIVKPSRISKDLRGAKFWISTKIDGQLWFLVKREGEVALVAYNGRSIRGIPLTDEATRLLSGVSDCILPGECFSTSGGEGRPTSHHVAKAFGDGDLAKRLGFKAFDLLELNGEDWFGKSYEDRFNKVTDLLGKGKRVAPVTTVVGDLEEVQTKYQEWVASKKAEGLVIRNEDRNTFKCKPTVTLDVVVLAFGERRAPNQGQVRDITVGVIRDDGSHQVVGTVGGGFSDQDRLDWFSKLSDIEVSSSFRLANKEGTLCRFVKPEIAIEIRVSDLLAFDADENPVRKMALSYTEDDGYKAIGQMPILSLVHPALVRIREDKTIDADNVGVDQLWKVVPFDNPHDGAEEENLPESTLVSRGVFTKLAKGKMMVRKYVALKTNKDETDPRFPAYVLHFTDFSPNRAEPLKTSLKVSKTEGGQAGQVEAWLAANIKKGWNKWEPETNA